MKTINRQHGSVLLISLIVLIVMTLGAFRLMRAVGITNVAAGNMAFKETGLATSDRAVQSATKWLMTAAATTLVADDTTGKYLAKAPATEPNWGDDATWSDPTGYFSLPEVAGNTVQYKIHRMCTLSGVAYDGEVSGVPNKCAIQEGSTGIPDGGSRRPGGVSAVKRPQVYYRITMRIQGVRSTQSVVQSFVLISA